MTMEEKIRLGTPATLEQMLDARERRAGRQRAFLRDHGPAAGCALICFTMNMPGEYKTYPLAQRAFGCGQRLIGEQLAAHAVPVYLAEQYMETTGYEAYYLIPADAARIKRMMVAVEHGHPLGRLFDIDVLDSAGNAVKGAQVGREERLCIVCGGPVWACARSRAHTAQQLTLHTARMIDGYFAGEYADHIAALATRALLYEVCITPKPGLVDRLGNGAHRDMDLFTFLDSSCAVSPYFRDIVRLSADFVGGVQSLLPALRYSGQRAERAMLAATGGVNTHKGLIFSMGVLCAALGWLYGRDEPPTPDKLFQTCSQIAGETPLELVGTGKQNATYGQTAFYRHGLTGARGEAAQGFPAVRLHGYPTLRAWTARGLSLNDAGVLALLCLMANVDDTNLIGRAGTGALHNIQQKLRPILTHETDSAKLLALAQELDDELTGAFLSPGGCADLLAVTLMVYFLFDEAPPSPG